MNTAYPLRKYVLLLMACLAACSTAPTATTTSIEPVHAGVTVTDKTGVPHLFHPEIARSDREIERGLMGRGHLSEDGGMLFVFPKPTSMDFWMKDIYMPLDILFIGADGTVSRIKASAQPEDWTPFSAGRPVSAVLEISGGKAKALGITVGSTVDYRDAE